jgi:hypothetical protein
MPRIEIIPYDFGAFVQPREDVGDPAPTVDVCTDCVCDFEKDQPAPPFCSFEGTVGSVDVEHPPYKDGDYWCHVCDKFLDELDE